MLSMQQCRDFGFFKSCFGIDGGQFSLSLLMNEGKKKNGTFTTGKNVTLRLLFVDDDVVVVKK